MPDEPLTVAWMEANIPDLVVEKNRQEVSSMRTDFRMLAWRDQAHGGWSLTIRAADGGQFNAHLRTTQRVRLAFAALGLPLGDGGLLP